MNEVIDEKNLIVMKLLHYFITEQNYNPIILQGAENEIWLENMDSDYKIVRIVSNHIHNDEQFKFDMFKTKHVLKKIRKKTLTFNMNVLTIFTDISDFLQLENSKNYDFVYISEEKDIKKYDFVTERFPDISSKLKFTEKGMELFMKITSDINKKNKKDQIEAEDVFKPKKPIVTTILIVLNILIFLIMMFVDKQNVILSMFCTYGPSIVVNGEFYRLITAVFLHGSIFHLLFNCYSLYVIGSQIESYMGKIKYLVIYIFSALCGSLLSILLNKGSASIGASGAIFGLLGSILYFGYHYRVYLGTVIKSQIIPLIMLNLLVGFMNSGIDNFAHIGGLIGGILITSAVGVKYKSSKSEIINGIILSLIFVIFMIVLAFKTIGV